MLFNSTVFFLFFGVFFAAYWSLRTRLRAQNVLILAGSAFFYGWWDERFLILIALSTACDYICGLGAAGEKLTRSDWRKAGAYLAAVSIAASFLTFAESWKLVAGVAAAALTGRAVFAALEKLSPEARRKGFVYASLAFNLGLLCVFKYLGFFADSFAEAARAVGFEVNHFTANIILPIGISFYTFQTLSYTIDIYSGRMKPTRAIVDFAAYVSFFPQLVAGPIERARRLLPQFEAKRLWDADRAAGGALLFMWGLYKKSVIADNLAPVVNAAFASASTSDPAFLALAIFAFALQIFCDFSGYSDMARGLARLLGFELMVNFDLPYTARTPSEFWRRWHISLSTWLRDYLYVPLGGNRGGRIKTYRNLMLTMLLGGLWHGAAWTFVLWGAFHGAILCVYRLLRIDEGLDAVKGVLKGAANLAAWLIMSGLTLIGWTIFRAETLHDAYAGIDALQDLLTPTGAAAFIAQPDAGYVFWLAAPLIASHLIGRFSAFRGWALGEKPTGAVLAFARYNGVLLLATLIFALAAEAQQDFIYFDF